MSKDEKKNRNEHNGKTLDIKTAITVDDVVKNASSPKLPFIHLADKFGFSKPLIEALKVEYRLSDSFQLSEEELIKKSEKWLCSKSNKPMS